MYPYSSNLNVMPPPSRAKKNWVVRGKYGYGYTKKRSGYDGSHIQSSETSQQLIVDVNLTNCRSCIYELRKVS